MNTSTLDQAFAALNTSMSSIVDDSKVSKKGNAIADSIDQFLEYVTGEGFATIMKEARGEPIVPRYVAKADVAPAETVRNDAAEYDRLAAEEVAKILGKTAPLVTKTALPLTAEQSFAKRLADNPAEYDRFEKQRYAAVAKLQLE